MKLDRNINDDGLGKYALLKLRRLKLYETQAPFSKYAPAIQNALELLENEGILDWGRQGTESEFMLIRLKDRYAQAALRAYAEAARQDDPEWADEVALMADRSGPASPFCQAPD